jgi:hypothetical protein
MTEDPFRVPDPEYETQTIPEPDRFAGYRALDPQEYSIWMQWIEDANS